MLERLLQYERGPFFLINGYHTPFLDGMMWLLSSMTVWAPLIAFLLFMLIYKKKWMEWLPVVISIALLFLLCDQFSSSICKPFFARPRPTHHPDFMYQVKTLYGYVGGRYGFISGHATNAFGFAMLTTLLFRNKTYTCIIFLWAALIAYSRVYLGVHFLSDVTAGAVSGVAIGFFVYRIYQLWLSYFGKRTEVLAYLGHRTQLSAVVIVCYTSLFSILSKDIMLFIK